MSTHKAKKAISNVAKVHHVSEESVKEEMIAAIADAIRSSDSEVQNLWKQIPCAGEVPDPEELIEWLTK